VKPSPEQIASFERKCASRAVTLFVQFETPPAQPLKQLVQQAGGILRWQGRAQQVLVGDVRMFAQLAQVQFEDSNARWRSRKAQAQATSPCSPCRRGASRSSRN
jgi:hypothetical protein